MNRSAPMTSFSWCAVAGACLISLNSCSSPRAHQAPVSPVHKVVVGHVPATHELAGHAKESVERYYPAVCALLDDGHSSFPSELEIHFKKQLSNNNMAETRLDQICLNAEYLDEFAHEPGTLDQVLVHEMTHVAQHYYRSIIGRWLIQDPRPARFWVEGIADYVCFRLGVTNEWHCATCNSAFAHYQDGYSCAGAFLLHLERAYDQSIVPELNTVLRQGRYSDDFFFQRTGKDLAALWAEFRQTEAFTPGAARMLELEDSLGFVRGKPPKDIERRVRSFLRQHADESTRELLDGAWVQGRKRADIHTRLCLIYYFSQPGGTAEAFMMGLQKKYELPGFSKGEHGTFSYTLNTRDLNISFPTTRSLTAAKRGETSIYHYTVYRSSEDTGWKLQRAWQASEDGHVLKELPVP